MIPIIKGGNQSKMWWREEGGTPNTPNTMGDEL
jgi:hypothetical protein